MTHTSEDNATVSRRSVVRIGANAAWAVPAISILAAAPSIACSAGATGFTISAVSIARGTGEDWRRRRATGSVNIFNEKAAGAGVLGSTPTLTVIVTGGQLVTLSTSSSDRPSLTGYTYTGGSRPSGSNTSTLTFRSNSSVAPCTSLNGTLTLRYNSATSGGSVQVKVSPANHSGATDVTDPL